MAYIERRPHGWRAQVRRKGSSSISRTFDLRNEAEAWAQEIERELRRGNHSIIQSGGHQATFDDVAELYANNALPALKSRKTSLSFLTRARERFGKRYITSIRGIDVAKWRDELLRSGLSPRSVGYCLAVLSTTFNYAARELSIQLPAGNQFSPFENQSSPWDGIVV